ncbi:hypothetical protein ACQRC6_03265 [Peptoniphilus sp. SGI.035]|uniref:hypothetical protein n=1 Tax=unclassified Peptoniphilus TaxID=2637196 RepID=UPI0025EAABAC|nr:hypothetical protein [Peptoniphilus sp.]MCI5643633.1 hypothetical protein [Peptoniphilus sp.]MDD7351915.1 hypothetical protein [Peptoniphilaceae bacterium]MDY3903099.1 hypothetical protein [Peptoniphilus sp.]
MDLAQKLIQKPIKSVAFKDIKKYLIANFLYKGDLDSINILLNLYNVYESIENIYPRYVTLENLRKDIIKIYRQKEGIELIAQNLSSLIHDDINRLELYLYLEAYRLGFNSKKHINILEIITLKYLTIDELYNRKKLFQYEFQNEEVLSFKKLIFKEIRKDKQIRIFIKNTLSDVKKKLLNEKINSINDHLDLQLSFKSENDDVKIREVDSYLTDSEIITLNNKISKFLYIDGFRIFRNGFWDGVNDRVLKRYK